MAVENQGKGGKPAKGEKSSKAGKSGKTSFSIGAFKSKQIIAVGVLLVLVVVAVIIYVFNGSGGGGSSEAASRQRTHETYEPDLSAANQQAAAPAAPVVTAAPEVPDTPPPSTPPTPIVQQSTPAPEQTGAANVSPPPSVNTGTADGEAIPAQPTPVVTPIPVKTMDMSFQARALVNSEEEFLRRYDETVKTGKWSELADWADRQGLYVEAWRMAAMEGQVTPAQPKFHSTHILVTESEKNEKKQQLMSQEAFEAISLKATVKDYAYSKVVAQLDEMQADGKISTLSRLSGLLVQADCPKGRELYQKSIKVKEFYEILVRAINQAYLSDIGPENVSQSGWFSSVPMNLWMIEQLITYDPVAAGTSGKGSGDANASTNISGASRPPMGPGGPMGPGPNASASQAGLDEGLLAHRLLLLQILARRGGEVSSYLVGKLLDADREEVLFGGLIAGKVNPNLFSRFTGIYAEPLIEPFARGLEKHKGVQQEWTILASVLASMFNDRGSNAIFTGAQDNNLTLSGDLTFFLAAGGTKYTLKNLSDFIRTSRAESPDIVKVFSLWTEISPESKKSFWQMFSDFLPGGPNDKSPTRTGGTPPPGFVQGPGPGPGNPSFGPGQQGLAKLPTRGWPVVRKFASTVDAESAREFLKLVGQMAVASSAETNSKPQGMPGGPMGPGMGPGGPNMGMGGNSGKDLSQVKLDAVRCLVSLYDPRLRDYFRALIDDANAGWMGRLGLCALDDRESCALLLKHFWKTPWELGPASSRNTSGMGGPSYGNQNQGQITITPGNISVSLDAMGLPTAGISARDALIYFDHRDAGKAFLASLGEFIVHKEPFDDPERVADAACQMIGALGRWATPGSPTMLADLIESTGDFGLRSAVRTTDNQGPNPMASRVRMKALEVLGQIGNDESLEVIIRIATYSKENDPIGLASRMALARRGASAGADLFLDMIDPDKVAKMQGQQGQNYSSPSNDPNQPSRQQIALLGLSRTKLSDTQISRAIGLVKKFGETSQTSQHMGTGNLQEDLVLNLLLRAQGPVLQALAGLIAEPPADEQGSTSGKAQDLYYWNRDGSPDKKFLKMVRALDQTEKFEDEQAVVQFVTAIIRREEAFLAPKTSGTGAQQQWDARQSLIKFDDSRRDASPGMFGGGLPAMPVMPAGGMPMGQSMDIPPEMMQTPGEPTRAGIGGTVKIPNMPGQQQRTLNLSPGTPGFSPTSGMPGVNPASAGKTGAKDEGFRILSISMPKIQGSERIEQQAALAGMNLIARLSGAGQYLKGLNDLAFYRYLASFMVWQAGDTSGRDNLVGLLADGGNDKYLKFLAIEHLEKSESLELMGCFAEAASRVSDPLVRARLADGAVYVAGRTWENQMIGGARALKDAEQVTKLAEPWKLIVEGKNYDRLLADPMVIALAALESSQQSVKLMQEVIRVQGTKDNPVAEQAVANAVTILRGLNPGGNTDLLGLYMSILTQTVNPERQKQALAEEKNPSPRPNPSSGRRISTGTGTGTRPMGPVPAYQSVGPLIIQAISEMKIPEALPALVQIARARPDLLGFAAIEIHKKDQKHGQSFLRSLFAESGKNPGLTPQAIMALLYLKTQQDRFYYDMLIRSLTKADPVVRQQALALLGEMSSNQTLPAEVNIVQTLKSVLQSMAADLREGKDVRAICTQVCTFAESLGDKDLSRLAERIAKAVEAFKPRENITPGGQRGPRTRSPSRSRG